MRAKACGVARFALTFAVLATTSNGAALAATVTDQRSNLGQSLLYPTCAPRPARPARAAQAPSSPGSSGGTAGAQAGPATNAALPATPQRTDQSEAEAPAVSVEKGGVVTKTTITSAAINEANSQSTYDAIKNVPGVVNTDARPGSGADSLQIRGIKLNSVASYRFEGALPIVNSINLPLEDKCKVEALKGTGALGYGIATPAGIINYVLKRATDAPVATLGYNGNVYGQAIGSFDFGERFGPGKEYGVRVSGAAGSTGPPIRSAFGSRYVGSFTADYEPSDRVAIQMDFEQLGINIVEQAALQLNKPVKGKIALPHVPDPTALLSGVWAFSRGFGQNIQGHVGYALGGGWTTVVDYGSSEATRPERHVAQISNYNVTTGVGTETVTLVQNQDYLNTYTNFKVGNELKSGILENDFDIGVTNNVRDFNNPQNPKVTYMQNIYNPVNLPAPFSPQGRVYFPNNNNDFDEFFNDTLSLYDRVHILGGLREINYAASDQVSKTLVKQNKSATLAPAIGLTYDLSPKVTAYASYVESLEITDQAPVNAANAYEVLPPAISNQKEVGIRGTNLGPLSPTLGYFRISEANATTDPVTNIYALNGTIVYEGLEGTLNARATRDLTLSAGGNWMRAVQHSTDPTINGKQAENTPYLSYNLGFSYRTPFLRGFSVTGGGQFIGTREINPQNQGTLPAVGLGTVGLGYAGHAGNRRFNFTMNCTNVTNLRYFANVVRGSLGVGAARTVTFGTRWDI